MRVKLRGDMSGTRNGAPWPARGEELDLPDEEAVALCAGGMAVPVDSDDTEKAVVADSAETRGPAESSSKPAAKSSSKPSTTA